LSRVFVGICLSILLLSTAGIPPMIGFFAKYEIIALAIEKGFILLAMVAVIASLISTVYYLRVNYTPLVQELSVPYVFVVQKTKIQYSYSFYSITLIVLFVILYFLQSMEIYTYLSL
jgi:NADH-quinone oxidoreductase subunit N